MKILKEIKLLLLLAMVLGLSACGDDYYSDDYLRRKIVCQYMGGRICCG